MKTVSKMFEIVGLLCMSIWVILLFLEFLEIGDWNLTRIVNTALVFFAIETLILVGIWIDNKINESDYL